MLIQNVNIKARRLGYLKLLQRFLLEDKGKRGFPTRFGKAASNFREQLLSYKDSHGEISHANPRASALPYIDLAKSLNLVELRIDALVISNEAIFFEESESPFELKLADISQCFELFKHKDALGLFIVFLSLSKTYSRYPITKDEYQQFVLKLIDRISNIHFLYPILDSLCLKAKNKWSIDSFLLPRLHWYYDLNLVEIIYTVSKHRTEELAARLAPTGANVRQQLLAIDLQLESLSETQFLDAIGNLTLE